MATIKGRYSVIIYISGIFRPIIHIGEQIMAEKGKAMPTKNIPTILPSGFGLRVTDKKIYVLDFFDLDYDNNSNVVGSFALDEKTVNLLVAKLNKAIEEVGKRENE
jgi:hypothetical protein